MTAQPSSGVKLDINIEGNGKVQTGNHQALPIIYSPALMMFKALHEEVIMHPARSQSGHRQRY